MTRRSLDEQQAARPFGRTHQDLPAIVPGHQLRRVDRHLHRVHGCQHRIGRHPEHRDGRGAVLRRPHAAHIHQTPGGAQPNVEGRVAQLVAHDGCTHIDDGADPDRLPGLQSRDFPVRARERIADAERVDRRRQPCGRRGHVAPPGCNAVRNDDDASDGPPAEPRRDTVQGAGEIRPRRAGRQCIDIDRSQRVAERQHLRLERLAQHGKQAIPDELPGAIDARLTARIRNGHAPRVVDQNGHDAVARRRGLGTQRPQQQEQDDEEGAQAQDRQGRLLAGRQVDRRPGIDAPRDNRRREDRDRDAPTWNRYADLHGINAYRRSRRGRGGWSASAR